VTSITPEAFRIDFPMLDGCVHLASCSQGARSVQLDNAVQEMMSSMTNHGAPWDLWVQEVETARQRFADFIHASPEEVAIVPNASIGAFQAASTLDYTRGGGIVSSDMEFPSLGHVWKSQEIRGAKVAFASECEGYVNTSEYASLIDRKTSLVSIPMVSYKNGARLPVNAVAADAHAAGSRVFVDAYQAAGVVPIDVRTLDCDYLVSGTLKYLLGLPGLAFLYIREGVGDQVLPQLTGWFGRVNPFEFDPQHVDYPAQARRVETGTPAIPSVYAANAGFNALARMDQADVWSYVSSLAEDIGTRLTDAGWRLYSPSDAHRRGPLVAVQSEDSGRLGAALKDRGVITSPRGQAVRLSLHYYNTHEDVDTCVQAFDDVTRNLNLR
jgi:selenocysteine lyase/cysteine desulfurase